MAAVCTLLVMEPYGSFAVRSCEVKDLADWYTMLYNPRPGYTTTLHCTQEVVYPLYVLNIFAFYFKILCCMLAILVLFCFKIFSHTLNNGDPSKIYAKFYNNQLDKQ